MHLYNAAADLIDRNLLARGDKVAVIDDQGSYSYAELGNRVDRFAGYLTGLGLPVESRILICLQDSIDFPVASLGAIKAGLVPVMVNPLLTSADLSYMLWDSRARLVVASAAVWPALAPALADKPHLDHILAADREPPAGTSSFATVLKAATPISVPAETRAGYLLWDHRPSSGRL